MMRRKLWAGAVIVTAAMAAAGTGCGKEGAEAQKTTSKAVQKAIPAARRAAWHGTVTVRRTAAGNPPDPSNNEFSETTHSISVLQTANLNLNGQTQANVSYTETTDTTFKHLYDVYTISGTGSVVITGSGVSGDADVNLEIYENGRYTIDYFARGVDGEQTNKTSSRLRCKPKVEAECKDWDDETEEKAPVSDLGSISGGVEGRIDKKNPNQLSGSHSEPYQQIEGVNGRTVVSWSLSR